MFNVGTSGVFLFSSILIDQDLGDPTLSKVDLLRFLQWYLNLNLHFS